MGIYLTVNGARAVVFLGVTQSSPSYREVSTSTSDYESIVYSSIRSITVYQRYPPMSKGLLASCDGPP